MSLALAQLLPEFNLPASKRALSASQNAKDKPQELDPVVAETLREEGRRQGREAATQELLARHAAELEKIHAVHQAELEEQAVRLASQIADAVPATIAARENRIVDHLADGFSNVLSPIVEETIREKMVAILMAEIRAALELEEAEKITVTGPKMWLDKMRMVFGSDLTNLEFLESDTVDIDVVIDQTRLSSRFEALDEMLREAMT